MNNVGGRAVANFGLACRTANKDDAGNAITDFYRVSVWGALAETCQRFLKKGSQVTITGNMKQRPYKDRNGADRMSIDITAESIEFGGGNQNAA
jgi:single-strand DNA-binding protein